jgi:LuxR family maltose regulon positive regulatory protein
MPRPRLSDKVADYGTFRLALVSAPAGAGKTTMLSEWFLTLQERQVTTAWLSLDAYDNEPRRFLVHLVSAIQAARSDIGKEALVYLTANPDMPVEDVVESLVHDFGTTNSPFVAFLDDYHEIRDRTIHKVVEFLLRYAPANVRFVIGTRKVPPLPVERLRVRGEILEIGWDDLRFNIEETREYLTGTCHLNLSVDQVRAFRRRTEGWITGLQLAAMTFSGEEDADRIVNSFSGEQRKITDYLLDTVFRRQTAGVRQFMMRTAILDRLTSPLCDVLTGRRDAQHMIETLEKGNLFLFGLDDRRVWYRYHHLFAEFLRNRLRIEHPEEMAGLHDRASEWYEKNGHLTEAVRYAIAGNRIARAARLLESAGRQLFRQGDFKELRRWIEALPDDTVRRSPVLCTLHAWALGYLGEFDPARRRIECAEKTSSRRAKPEGGSTTNRASIRAELRVLRAVLGIIRTDEPDISALRPGIVSLFPKDELVLRSYASIALGFASRVSGNLPLALRHFQKALDVSEGSNSSLVNLNARLNIGIVMYLMGRNGAAEQSFRKSLDVARERLWLRSIGAAFLRYGLALTLQEKNRLGEALEELSQAIEILETGDAFGFLGMALVERARTQVMLGKRDLALADLAQALQIASDHDVERVSFRADLLEARMGTIEKDLAKAERALEAARSVSGPVNFRGRAVFTEKHEYFLVERLRVLLAMERFGEATKLAARALRSAVSAGRGRNAVDILVLQAVAWNGLSRPEKALSALERALFLSRDDGIVRPFVDAGRELIPLLRKLKSGDISRTSAAAILSALEDHGKPVAGGMTAGGISESFHHREVQILELASQGLRNREIGEHLFLSGETVKWYMKRLFCKLGVRTRTEAIANARKLGLLA